MIAIGKPGEMSRLFFEGSVEQLAFQIEEGEVFSVDVQLDENGFPIAKPLVASTSDAS